MELRHPLQRLTGPPTKPQYPRHPRYLTHSNEQYRLSFFFLDIFRYFESGVYQGSFQRHGENMFITSLQDVKYKNIVFIAIHNQWDISAALFHRTSEKGWHIFQ